VQLLPFGCAWRYPIEQGHTAMRYRRTARSAAAGTIYEIGEHDSQPFIAMQFLEGETMRRRIEGKPLKADTLLEVAIQIVDALSTLHAQGESFIATLSRRISS
jgi:hypothetical protein